MFDGNWRETVEKGVDPIGEGLRKMGISADVLTCVGIAMSVATAFIIGNGYLRWGFVAMLATGIPDLLDGAVAKASGSASKRGAFFDSSIDRFSDAFVFGGISWYYAANFPGTLSILPVAVMSAALITSYLRAKGELLGYDAKGGIMERAERFILLAVGLAFPRLLEPVLWVMLVLTSVTVIQRFFKVWKQATVEMKADQAKAATSANR
jgi:CDP-diacylglycerol--glycerol-3-phosphate 3-phosphatidyltransferase